MIWGAAPSFPRYAAQMKACAEGSHNLSQSQGTTPARGGPGFWLSSRKVSNTLDMHTQSLSLTR